jgi:hypothetical protein
MRELSGHSVEKHESKAQDGIPVTRFNGKIAVRKAFQEDTVGQCYS